MNCIPLHAFTDNYIWAIPDETGSGFICVDPGQALPVIRFAKENHLILRSILITHHHFDHIGGIEELVLAFPECIVYGPDDSRIPSIHHKVYRNETIQIGSLSFNILFNPGHTSTHISYFEPSKKWLFCGDTLFSAGCGRVFDGTIEELFQSMQLFKSLPEDTKIFCAHEYTLKNLEFAHKVEPSNLHIIQYMNKLRNSPNICSLPSTVALELECNPFLRTKSKEVQDFALNHGGSTEELDVFRIVREQKNLAN